MFRVITTIASIAALALTTSALAAELPKSGSFSTAMGGTVIGETIQAGGRTLGYGSHSNVIVGDNPLHIRGSKCPYISEQSGDTVSVNGRCAWSDADGDQIFSEWSVKCSVSTGSCQGPQTFTGGSGKFRDIRGSNPPQCQMLNATQFTCTNQWTYQLP